MRGNKPYRQPSTKFKLRANKALYGTYLFFVTIITVTRVSGLELMLMKIESLVIANITIIIVSVSVFMKLHIHALYLNSYMCTLLTSMILQIIPL